ncbi:hypothetical protein NO348_18645 [Hungatella hathewayi]|uniref:hypothetical protein n=1 Tax=Hungatella hathewayi TaxID=154046 RepID=UPI00210D5C12|nr:hypothetical protein [Hungatella hathewayi]MCQ5386847.1 hypothetical protein [Hungatella hathewayi]
MAKKGNGFGKLVAFATIAGAVAAGISYFTKYKSFHKELEEDFHDFEDDGNDDISKIDSTMNRNYVSLHADKDEFKVAAADMADAAKDAASAAKNLVKDAANIVNSTAREAASAVADTAKDMLDTAMDRSEDDEEEDITEDGGLDYAAGAADSFKEEPEQAADNEDKEDSDEVEEIYEGTGDALKKFAAEESTTIVEDTVDEP